MMQIQLINNIIEWERRLEIEEERRHNRRSEPDLNDPVMFQSSHTADITETVNKAELAEKEQGNRLCRATMTCQPAA